MDKIYERILKMIKKNLRKQGKLASGNKRYYCKDCKKGFSTSTIIREKITATCPRCNGNHIVRCGHMNGQQRYQCKDCNHKFTLEPIRKVDNKINIICPKCKNEYAVKCGFSEDGRQYYRCTECKHKFTQNNIYRHLTQKDKQRIIELHNQGLTNKAIAEELNVDVKTIFNTLKMSTEQIKSFIVKKVLSGQNPEIFYDKFRLTKEEIDSTLEEFYKQETLTIPQKQMIYKFGVLLNTDAEYVAPYIPCSVKLCKEYINKYPKKKSVRYERTQKDIALDKLDLDRFLYS